MLPMVFTGCDWGEDAQRYRLLTVNHWNSQAIFWSDLFSDGCWPPRIISLDGTPVVGHEFRIAVSNGSAVYRLTEYELERDAWYGRLVSTEGEAPVLHTWEERSA